MRRDYTKLNEYREAELMSYRDFAARLGMNQATLFNIITGRTRAQYRHARQLNAWMDAHAEEIDRAVGERIEG